MFRLTQWVTHAVVVAAVLVAGMTACGGGDGPTSPPSRAVPGVPHLEVFYGDGACPWYIAEEDCMPLNETERENMIWDLQRGIQWWDPDCAAVGNHMVDFMRYGDVKRYPNDGVSAGVWQLFTTGEQRISFNDVIVWQGWSSTADRVRAMIHEGWHSYTMSDDEDGAYTFEDGCIDW
jgi:hypothetical protein